MLGSRFIALLHESETADEKRHRRNGDMAQKVVPHKAMPHRSGLSRSASLWSIIFALALVVVAVLLRPKPRPEGDVCVCHDQPNQLASLHPGSATGTLNATVMVIPIAMSRARQLIPPQHAILEKDLRRAFPQLADDTYPVLLQAAHDHDVQLLAYNMSIPDFSRVGFEFPFLDLLGDGRTAFRWAPAQLISATNEMAIGGSRAYGTVVSPASFQPACNAYAPSPRGGSTTTFQARSADDEGQHSIELSTTRAAAIATATVEGIIAQEGNTGRTVAGETAAAVGFAAQFPLAFIEQALNQPAFADGSTCDRMQRPFHTALSAGRFAPAVVRGTVAAAGLAPFADSKEVWQDVYGVQIATPFVEDNYLDCATLTA